MEDKRQIAGDLSARVWKGLARLRAIILIPHPVTVGATLAELVELAALLLGIPVVAWRASKHLKRIHELLERIHGSLNE